MRKKLRRTLMALAGLSLALLALEGAYRLQIVDMYRPELQAFNSVETLESRDRPTLLAMGDSFTAGRASYAGILQNTLRGWRVANAGVSGTGVVQTLAMAPRRFTRFRPSIFVYQVYVGNDLFDVRYPIDWHAVSFARNVYWLFADRLRFLGYVNYRVGQLQTRSIAPVEASSSNSDSVPDDPEDAEGFSVERYDARVKVYLRAEPGLIEDSILAQGGRRESYAAFVQNLARLLAYCQPGMCRAYVLIIPHVSQVDEAYLANMRQLGASFRDPAALRRSDYPFVAGLRDHFAHWPNVTIVNPLPELRTAQAQRPMYHANDEHLNAAGQHEIAALLKQRLELR